MDGKTCLSRLPVEASRVAEAEKLMESKTGTYVLVLKSPLRKTIRIGSRGDLALRPGYYLYVGSAFGPGGVLSRVSRHCRIDKAKHWHIDYLRSHTAIESIWYSHAGRRLEHVLARVLAQMEGMTPEIAFGASDCKCESHLFFTPVAPEPSGLAETVRCTLVSRSCKEERRSENS